MPRKLTQEEFINKSILKHGDKYNYDEVSYVNNRTKVDIICNTCKNTFQQTPTNHLSGQGCPICSGNQRSSKIEFIKKSILKHGNKYNYDGVNYINNHTKIDIYCNTCGNTFLQKPNDHSVGGQGCSNCYGNKKSSTEEFINNSILIHKDKYNYNSVNYINNRTKVNIFCNTCNNTFQQSPADHLSGSGCICNNKGRYNNRYFIKYPEMKDVLGYLYFKKFVNIITNETFYKLGITIGGRYFGKDYEVTNIEELPMALYEAFLKEQILLKKFKNLKHNPKLYFAGHSECFVEDIINQEEIINIFNL